MTQWIATQAHWFVEPKHPGRNVARIFALILALMPFLVSALLIFG